MGDPPGNSKGDYRAQSDQQEQGNDHALNQTPVFQNAHGGGDEQNRQDGHQKAPGILHLLQFYNAKAQGREQQCQTVHRRGNRQGNDPLEQFTCQRKGGNAQKLG